MSRNGTHARRLRAVFGDKLNRKTINRLVEDFDGASAVIAFITNEDDDEVLHYLETDPDHVRDLKQDCKKLTIKNNKARLFVCPKCTAPWWKKVPERNETCTCRNCKIECDPIPRVLERGPGRCARKGAQARRLREVFGDKLNRKTINRLIDDFDGASAALEFIINENADVVLNYLKTDPDHVRDLKEDGQKLPVNKVKATVRQFYCKKCKKSWLKKVPERREVCTCRNCTIDLDPIPRDREWGLGAFTCDCGNKFTGYAMMGVTSSACYDCGRMVDVGHISPPRPNRPKRKTELRHSCNGVNCSSHGDFAGSGCDKVEASSNATITTDKTQSSRPMCAHPSKFKISVFSNVHRG